MSTKFVPTTVFYDTFNAMKGLVVAHSANRVIGNQGTIPWAGSMPEDMKRFRRITLGHAVIMGRLTFESIGRPLPGRTNIVVSRSLQRVEGCRVARSLSSAYDMVDDESYVIGGSRLYAEALEEVDRCYVTKIDALYEGDAFFPELDPDVWQTIEDTTYAADKCNVHDYRFMTYTRAGRRD